jgi:hypothetical protein
MQKVAIFGNNGKKAPNQTFLSNSLYINKFARFFPFNIYAILPANP